mgnify:CR=1 FL=1
MMLPVTKASDIGEERLEARWLIEELWLDQAVGFIGGEPKTCKTSLSLEVAVAVASGRPCLRRFAVTKSGRVLLYAAEDSLAIIKRRLAAICQRSELLLSDCDIHLITAPIVKLDVSDHRQDLAETLAAIKPALLILDPFIRMHSVDENHAGEIAPLLGYLRSLQRRYQTAIIVVHHARKRSGNVRAGQSLRGSSEFHAWYDSHLYLSRQNNNTLTLDIEHRSAPSLEGINLEIIQASDAVILEIVEEKKVVPISSSTVEEKIIAVLTGANAPVSLSDLRQCCRIRKQTIVRILAELERAKEIVKTPTGYQLPT